MRQFALPFAETITMAAHDFMVADCNRQAATMVGKWPDWPFFALLLQGDTGAGKTHLARIWQQKTHAIWLSGADLVYADILEQVTTKSCIVIDDLTAEFHQVHFFHLYNLIQQNQGSVLITTETAPASWHIELADARSRLLGIPMFAIHSPDEQFLMGLMLKLFKDRQLRINQEVLSYLQVRLPRDYAFLHRFVQQIAAQSLHDRKNITIPLVRNILEKMQ